jgi:hypothetical protein
VYRTVDGVLKSRKYITTTITVTVTTAAASTILLLLTTTTTTTNAAAAQTYYIYFIAAMHCVSSLMYVVCFHSLHAHISGTRIPSRNSSGKTSGFYFIIIRLLTD